jgi:hypothetical protein
MFQQANANLQYQFGFNTLNSGLPNYLPQPENLDVNIIRLGFLHSKHVELSERHPGNNLGKL